MSLERIAPAIQPAEDRVSALFYGCNLPIFNEANVEVASNDSNRKYEHPVLLRLAHGAVLKLSEEGADAWEEKLSLPCERVGINPVDLYVTSGAALLEITIAAQQSLDGDAEVRSRVMKTYKMLGKGDKIKDMAAHLGEETKVSVGEILTAFDYEEMLKMNYLRYGIGIALRAMELGTKEVNAFQTVAQAEAVRTLNSYYSSAAHYLSTQAFSAEESARTIDKVFSLDPPVLEFAASAPMNVSYLLPH